MQLYNQVEILVFLLNILFSKRTEDMFQYKDEDLNLVIVALGIRDTDNIVDACASSTLHY